MAVILLSTEATAGDTFNTHACYLQGMNRMTLTPISGQAVDFALKVSSRPAPTSPLWFAEFNYLSPIKSLDRFSGVVVYHARFSAQTLFLEIGCYYLLSPRAWHRRKLLLWLLTLPSKPFCLNP